MKKLTQILLAVLIFGLFLSCQTAKPTDTSLPVLTSELTFWLDIEGASYFILGDKTVSYVNEAEQPYSMSNNIDVYKISAKNKRAGLYRIGQNGWNELGVFIDTEEGWKHIKTFASHEELLSWLTSETE